MKIGLGYKARDQLILFLLGFLYVAQFLGVSFHTKTEDTRLIRFKAKDVADRLVQAGVLAEASAPSVRQSIIRSLSSTNFNLTSGGTPGVKPPDGHSTDLSEHVTGQLQLDPAKDLRVVAEKQPGKPLLSGGSLFGDDLYLVAASIRLKSGEWLTARDILQIRKPWARLATSMLATSLIVVTGVLLLTTGFARRLLRLTAAAEKLGRDNELIQVPLEGRPELANLTLAFNAMAERLTRLLSERAHILAVIGHDLGSPITAMRLRIELLDDDETKERLTVCLDEIQSLVAAALALSKGGDATEVPAEFPLDAMLQDLADEFRETGVDVLLLKADRVRMYGRQASLRRAIRNVIENAVRYGNCARLFLSVRGHDVEIVVEDDGPGIPFSDRQRVFEPFVRLEQSRVGAVSGSGLGLALAKKVMEAHGGVIQFLDPEIRGARVIMRLPYRQATVQPD
ncbi:sensor histidine kinase [Rhizobium panacihumi]|uniref:sensor histidine kinase n=1 Tax=Rhizobium panacihumi TaxID=2008450 RepID=UPI003D79F2D9